MDSDFVQKIGDTNMIRSLKYDVHPIVSSEKKPPLINHHKFHLVEYGLVRTQKAPFDITIS